MSLASLKGGVGKTTLAGALAVRAAEESRRVALLDLDPQESLASWWTRRGKVKNPKLFEVDATAEAIELLVSEGWHADGDQTEIKALVRDYRTWCAQKGFTPIELNAFLDEIEKLLRQLS